MSLFGLPQEKSPGPHVKDQESNPRPHTPRPAESSLEDLFVIDLMTVATNLKRWIVIAVAAA